jgi:hypothetical protein
LERHRPASRFDHGRHARRACLHWQFADGGIEHPGGSSWPDERGMLTADRAEIRAR